MFDFIDSLKKKFWDWSSHAGTIVNARLTAIFGFMTSALSFADWSPLLSLFGVDTGFSHKQAFWVGAVIFVKGIVDELVRRANTVKTEAGKLLPKDITMPEVKAAKKNAEE